MRYCPRCGQEETIDRAFCQKCKTELVDNKVEFKAKTGKKVVFIYLLFAIIFFLSAFLIGGLNDYEYYSGDETCYNERFTFRDGKDNFLMDGSVLKCRSVRFEKDEDDTYYLSIEISDTETFYRVTETLRTTSEPLVMWIDYAEEFNSFDLERYTCGYTESKCIFYGYISEEIKSNMVTLRAGYTYDEAKALTDRINSIE